jgi:hypothetical protein
MEQQIEIYKQKMIQNYSRATDNIKWQKDYANSIRISEGRKYYKVTIKKVNSDCSRFVPEDTHSFIVKQDDAKFSKGDILKAASYQQAETDFPRGNIFENFLVGWAGAYTPSGDVLEDLAF